MSKLIVALFGLVILVTYAECARLGNSFQAKLFTCREFHCGNEGGYVLKDKDAVLGTCVVMFSRDGITVTECEAACLKESRVRLGRTQKCKCRNDRICISTLSATSESPAIYNGASDTPIFTTTANYTDSSFPSTDAPSSDAWIWTTPSNYTNSSFSSTAAPSSDAWIRTTPSNYTNSPLPSTAAPTSDDWIRTTPSNYTNSPLPSTAAPTDSSYTSSDVPHESTSTDSSASYRYSRIKLRTFDSK